VAYQVTDNTDFVVGKVSKADGVLEDELIPNPDQRLWKTTYTIRPGEWLVAPAEIEKAYGSLAEFAAVHGSSLRSPGTWRKVERLATGRAWGVGSQLLSSLTASASWSKRPTALNIGPEFAGEDDTVRTWNFKFDPAPFFSSASARKSGYAALKAYLSAFGKADAQPLGDETHPCKGRTLSACADVMGVSSGRSLSRALGTLLPTFEIQSLDEFDFRQVGGRFILPLPSQRESSLETFSFTWDLKRIVAGRGTERASALSAAKAYAEVEAALKEPEAVPFSVPPQTVRAPSAGKLYYSRLRAVSGIGQLEWSVEGRPNAFPGVELTSDGVLFGIPDVCHTAGGCNHEFTVTVRDDKQRTAQCTVNIVQR
jgi:hypothetical protein